MNSLYSGNRPQPFLQTIEIESLSHAAAKPSSGQPTTLEKCFACWVRQAVANATSVDRRAEPIQRVGCIGDSEITVRQTVFEARRVGLVFQDHALFPHMTVAENIQFGLKDGSEERTNTLLALVELTDFQDRYPHSLAVNNSEWR